MKNTRKAFYATSIFILLFGIVAWSPTPTTDDVIVGNTTVTSPSGQNVIIGAGSSGKAANSLVVGINHVISNAPEDSARSASIISGSANTVDATQSLVCGYGNTVNSVDALETRNSCAIGSSNQITSAHACVIGHQNIVSGDWSSAFGTWLKVGHSSVVAVGQYNEPTVSGDVFVVGAGSSDTVRNTVLKVNNSNLILGSNTNGNVVLARVQGDISMGAYAN